MTFAVIGGVLLDRALGPVVALAADDGAAIEVFCTGVVVGPRHVLTAGHCAGYAEASVADGAVPVVAWGGDLADGVPIEVLGWAAVAVHPEASDLSHDHDLAVVTLDGDLAVEPAALASEPPAVGDSLAFYGFGAASEGGASEAGVLRGTRLEVLDVDDLVFRSFAPGTNLCSGDSGGPAVATVDDGWWVVGVDTFVDPACLGGQAGSTRVDAHLDWLADVVGDLVLSPIGPADVPRVDAGGCSAGPAPTGLPMVGWVAGLAALSRRTRSTATAMPQGSVKSA